MLSKFFSDTCIISYYNDQIVGYASSFYLPQETETLFIWQVAVATLHKGKGLGKALLKELLKREECSDVCFIKTTVTPLNIASRSLFEGLARDLGACFKVTDLFPGEMFPERGHEVEQLYTIGPFSETF